MKKLFMLCVGLILFFQPADSQNLEMRFFVDNPYLAAGDANVSLRVLLINVSASDVEDLRTRLVLTYPFSPSVLTSPTVRSDLYSLRLLERNSSVQIEFKIDVDGKASFGDYEIPLIVEYSMGNDSYEEVFTVTLHVAGETLVDIVEMDTDENIEVGQEFEVAFEVRNVGKNAIEWMRVSLSLDENSPVLSMQSSEQIFRNFKSGSTVTARFTLATKRSIDPDTYLIPVVLTYQDEAKLSYESRETLGITILGRAEVDVAGIKVTPEQIRAGDRVTLAIQLDNTGTGNARAVSGTLSCASLTLQSYSGEIKRGDSGALFFSFPVPGDASLEVPYTLSIAFEDDFGAHAFDTPGKLNLEREGGGGGTSVYGALIAVVLLVVILAWLWRRRARR